MDRDSRLVEIVPRFLIRDLVLERAAHQLLREIAQARPGGHLAAEALAQELVGHLIAAHSNLALPPRNRLHTLAPSRLKRVQEFMRANLATELSLQDGRCCRHERVPLRARLQGRHRSAAASISDGAAPG